MKSEKALKCLVCGWYGDYEDLDVIFKNVEGFELTFDEIDETDKKDIIEYPSCPDCGNINLNETIEYETKKNSRNIAWCRKKIKELERELYAMMDVIEKKHERLNQIKPSFKKTVRKTVKKRKLVK